MKFILIVVLYARAASIGEFDDKAACENAARAVKIFYNNSYVMAQCFPKSTKE